MRAMPTWPQSSTVSAWYSLLITQVFGEFFGGSFQGRYFDGSLGLWVISVLWESDFMGVFSFRISRWTFRKAPSLSQHHGIFKHHEFWFLLVTRFPSIKQLTEANTNQKLLPIGREHSLTCKASKDQFSDIMAIIFGSQPEVFINCLLPIWKEECNDSNTDPSQRSLCAWVNAPRWITAFLPFRSNPCALLRKLASSGWMMDSYEQLLVGQSLSSTTQRFVPTHPEFQTAQLFSRGRNHENTMINPSLP